MRRLTGIFVAVVVVSAGAAILGSARGAAPTDRVARAADHRGGTLKLLAKAAAGTIDPQVNYTLAYWQLYQASYDGLLAFKKAGGNGAFQVVPDLAQSIPTPTNGGKKWVFKIRKGIKFSNGKTVTPTDVAASFRRIFKVKSPTSGTFYAGIVGADACLKKPAACTLKGGVLANDKAGTVTINLVRPDSEFKYRLAVPHASILPADAPPRDAGTKPIPGTGSYYFASYDPNKQIVLKRNPHFKQWSQDAQPDGLRRRDHRVVRPHRRVADHRDPEWPGRLDARGAAGRPAQRARHEVRLAGAREPADRVLVRADEHEHPTVQQPQGAAGRQLCDQPELRGEDLRRSPACVSVVPGAASGLPGPPGLLPVHEEPGREMVGARPREGEGARQGVGHRRDRRSPSSRRTTK